MTAKYKVWLENYWLEHYLNRTPGKQLCSLCGNSGVIDTRQTAVSAAGINAGRLNPCICPNGQALREQGADLETWVKNR